MWIFWDGEGFSNQCETLLRCVIDFPIVELI